MTWPDLAAVAVRVASIGLALEAAGVAFLIWFLSPDHDNATTKKSAIRLAGLAAIVTLLQHFIMPARLAGSFSGVLDMSLQSFYLGTDAGTATIVRVLGLALVLAGLQIRNHIVAVGGGVLTCMSFALMGHTVTYGERWLLAPLLLVHVIIVAFWFGSLRPLRRSVGNVALASVLSRFSSVAVKLVPWILVAGIGMAWGLLPSLAVLATPYGAMLIAKISGFAVLIALAFQNRKRLTPKIAAGDDSAALKFRQIAFAEWLIIWAVVIVTVSVTSFYSPGG